MDDMDARLSERKARVRFLLLGPVQVMLGDRTVPLGGPGVRSVLAMLLLEPNRVVPLDRIVDVLWADEPPASARTMIQGYVSRLRQRLSEAGADVQILSSPPGYQLVVDESLIDVTVARSLLAGTRGLPVARRVELLKEASALWRGPALADLGGRVSAPELTELRLAIQNALDATSTASAIRTGRHRADERGGSLSEQHLLPDTIVAFVDGALSPTAHDRAIAHLATCAICPAEITAQRQARSAIQAADLSFTPAELLESQQASREPAEMPESPQGVDDTDDDYHYLAPGPGGGVDTAVRTGTFPVSIYLFDGGGHEDVEAAVTRVLELAGTPIVERDAPVLGSWLRRMRANPTAREIAVTAAHAADTRLVHGPDAQVTATLLQHIGPVITALQPEKEAVVRLGAVLIVKVDDKLMVHQLTAPQQFQLDHQPQLVAPRDILAALGLPLATNGHRQSSSASMQAMTEEFSPPLPGANNDLGGS